MTIIHFPKNCYSISYSVKNKNFDIDLYTSITRLFLLVFITSAFHLHQTTISAHRHPRNHPRKNRKVSCTNHHHRPQGSSLKAISVIHRQRRISKIGGTLVHIGGKLSSFVQIRIVYRSAV